MGVGAGFAALDGHRTTSVRTGQVGREIQVEEVAPERQTVRVLGGRAGTDCQDIVRARPVKLEFGLEHLDVGVRLRPLAVDGGGVVHQCPTTRNEVRCCAQRIGEGVSAVNTRNGEGVVCTNNVVRAFLPVGGQVAIGQVVAGQTLVSHDASAVETRQGETWESAHVDLVGRQTRRRADGIVVSEFDVRQMQVPIALSLVDDHGQHLGHSMVHPLNFPVTSLRTPNSWYTACERLEQNCRPLFESMVRGHSHKGEHWSTRILAVLIPVSPGNETAWILTRPRVQPADLLFRRFRGGECYKA